VVQDLVRRQEQVLLRAVRETLECHHTSCSTAGRLKLLNNTEESIHANSVALEKSFVEDQLNEFRSFGDSITASGLLPPMNAYFCFAAGVSY
jgi:hypothetical protein